MLTKHEDCIVDAEILPEQFDNKILAWRGLLLVSYRQFGELGVLK